MSAYGTTPVLVATEIIYDPRYGFQRQETYQGTPQSILNLQAAFVLTGVRTQFLQAGGVGTLLVYYGLQDPNTVETPTDFWELEDEYVQESVWRNELVVDAAKSGNDNDYTKIARWKRDILAALDGKAVDDSGNVIDGSEIEGPYDPADLKFLDWDPFQLKLYKQFLLDMVAHETTRQVLVRVRSISVNYTPRVVAQATPTVYSTASLVANFAVPASVASDLPLTPTRKPDDTDWGWKQTRNQRRYSWSGRVEEVSAWTFAAWSTLTHTFV